MKIIPKPQTNAIHVTLYDVSGAPLDPRLVGELVTFTQELVKRESQLAINIAGE